MSEGLKQKLPNGENMKTRKWLKVTLIVLLALVALVAAAGAGFRVGVMQSGNIAQRLNARAQGANQQPNANGWMTNPHTQGFDPRFGPERDFGRGRGGFFPPLFGLFHLLVFGGLIWLGYKLVKNSGWKLTREAAPQNVEEKKDAA